MNESASNFNEEIKSRLDNDTFQDVSYICRHSELICNFINKYPDILDFLNCYKGKSRTKNEINKDISAIASVSESEDAFLRKLRFSRMKEYLLIAYNDIIKGMSLKEITAHISAFASAVLELSYNKAYNELSNNFGEPFLEKNGSKSRFCVLGLGKLGGWELNFSSDIDIMFVYESEMGTTSGGIKGSIKNHEFFTKISEKIKYFISENTADGIVFRVDLRLRPDGDKGALALPLRSYEVYYESYGQSWERMMLLKALPVAGDYELGGEFFEIVKPFIFKKSIDYKLIDELSGIKSKINQRVKYKKDKMNVKLGKGGIREVEFIIQVLQILNYHKCPEIYKMNSLDALSALSKYNIISDDARCILSDGYIFLRKLEHMAQLEKGLQTHRIPVNSDNFEKYVERCGYKSQSELIGDYEYHTGNISEIFKSILKNNEVSSVSIVFDEELNDEDIAEYLESTGMKYPEECGHILKRIAKGRGAKPRSASESHILAKLLSIIIDEVTHIQNPVATLHYFEKFFSGSNTVHFFFDVFCEIPKILSRITTLFSISPYLANIIIKNNNILDYIYDPKNPNYDQDDIFEIFYSKVSPISNDDEYEFDVVRRKHQELVFNIGYSYINKGINVIQFNRSLSKLAKAIVRLAFVREEEKLSDRYGKPLTTNEETCGFTVIGMGKLGSEEMSLGTDLDMIVLYQEEGQCSVKQVSNKEFYSKLVQKVITYLSTITVFGFLYKIDMRLRPSGASGTLVTSFKSFEDYQKNKSMTWEKQAMLRADVVFSSKEHLSEKFYTAKNDLLFRKRISKKEIKDIYDMRLRIEKEKGSPVNKNDIKAGYGGIVDIEFTVQALQLYFGSENENLQKTSTHEALHMFKENNILGNRDFYALHNSYLFYRNLENLIRAYQNTSSSKFPKDKSTLEHISSFFGFKDDGGEKLFKEYSSVRKTVRSAFNRIFDKYL